MSYQGHVSDGSSIQRHSVGSGYPFIFSVREDTEKGYGHAEVTDSLMRVRYRHSYPLYDKDARLSAYEAALGMQDVLASQHRFTNALRTGRL